MLTLRASNRFNEFVLLDPQKMEWIRVPDPSKIKLPIQGFFFEKQGTMYWFFRASDHLFFGVNKQRIEITDGMVSKLTKVDEKHNEFSLIESGETKFTCVYERPVIWPPLELDPTPFISEEDHDFFLLVHNVMNDKTRLARIFRRSS